MKERRARRRDVGLGVCVNQKAMPTVYRVLLEIYL